MSRDRRRTLHLPAASSRTRRVFRKKKRPTRLQLVANGLLLLSLGAGILVGLLQLPERLDTLLLVSNAIANLISGVIRFATGLLQLLGVLALVAVALSALVLLVAGVVRLGKALLMPRSR
ncbi:MAG: hypothetical protein VKK94_03355 [Cyanobacteriota bacterium]|nr:hypothetical protein [Cyanobacteriota bacterium]